MLLGCSSASLGIIFEPAAGRYCSQKFPDQITRQEKICGGQMYVDGNCYVCVECFKSVRIDEAPPISGTTNCISLQVPKKTYPQKEKKPETRKSSSASRTIKSPKPKTGFQESGNGNGKKKRNGNGRKKSTTKVKNPKVVQSRQSAKVEIEKALEEFYS